MNKTSKSKLEACARQRAKIKADPTLLAKQREYMREYVKKNRLKLNEDASKRYHSDSVKKFKYRLRRIGVEATDELLEQLINHSGLCDICGSSGDGRWKELAIDHCHTTHEYRGMLCSSCNRGLGLFKENLQLMEVAMNYLKRDRKLIPNEYVPG